MKTLLTATLLVSTAVQAAPTDLMRTQQTQAHKIIRSQLVDPDSAKFIEDSYVVQENTANICGVVNARNRMGGYAGNQLYYVAFDLSGKPVDYDVVPQFNSYDRIEVVRAKGVVHDRWQAACKDGKSEASLVD